MLIFLNVKKFVKCCLNSSMRLKIERKLLEYYNRTSCRIFMSYDSELLLKPQIWTDCWFKICMQSLKLQRGSFSLLMLYAWGAHKKNNMREFQGATRSSGPESEMLVGTLVCFFCPFVDEQETSRKQTCRARPLSEREREGKGNLFVVRMKERKSCNGESCCTWHTNHDYTSMQCFGHCCSK